MMEYVPMIILGIAVVLAIVVYPKKDTFIEKVRFKGSLKSFELEICTKEKNGSPDESNRSNRNN